MRTCNITSIFRLTLREAFIIFPRLMVAKLRKPKRSHEFIYVASRGHLSHWWIRIVVGSSIIINVSMKGRNKVRTILQGREKLNSVNCNDTCLFTGGG